MTNRTDVFVDQLDNTIETMPLLNESENVAASLHNVIINHEGLRRVADLLHGTWLGHPLHPVLTDLTVGSLTLGTLFDILASLTRSRQMQQTGDMLLDLGTISSVPTALAGITDYSGIKQDAAKHGLLHGLLNGMVMLSYIVSMLTRKSGDRRNGTLFSVLGMTIATISAYIGGDLVYRLRVGVDHSPRKDEPRTWTPIMNNFDLTEGEPRRIDVAGQPVLIYRYQGTVYAIGAVCAHAGGPLEEGQFYDYCVQCPWHDSVYDLRDGHVVHGPSTYHQPWYETRLNNGQIELRLGSAG